MAIIEETATKGRELAMKVLIVDDDRDLVETIKDALEELDFNANTVYSGQKALALVSSAYDAVICDVNMPITSGYEVMAEARNKGVERVIAISGMNAEWESKAKGATDFLKKPLDYIRLIKLLES